MADKRKSIRLGNKIIKCRQNVYYRFKENAKKQRLSQVAYLEKLITEDETTGIRREISKHTGILDNLMTQYVDPSFSELFTYLRVIFLRSGELDKEKRKEFLEVFNSQIKDAMESMRAYTSGQKGV